MKFRWEDGTEKEVSSKVAPCGIKHRGMRPSEVVMTERDFTNILQMDPDSRERFLSKMGSTLWMHIKLGV